MTWYLVQCSAVGRQHKSICAAVDWSDSVIGRWWRKWSIVQQCSTIGR